MRFSQLLFRMLATVAIGVNICMVAFFFSVLIDSSPADYQFGFLNEMHGMPQTQNVTTGTLNANRHKPTLIRTEDLIFQGGVNASYAVVTVDGVDVAVLRFSANFIEEQLANLQKGQVLTYSVTLPNGSTHQLDFSRAELKKLQQKLQTPEQRLVFTRVCNHHLFRDNELVQFGLDRGRIKQLVQELTGKTTAEALKLYSPDHERFFVLSPEELKALNSYMKQTGGDFMIITKPSYRPSIGVITTLVETAMQLTGFDAFTGLIAVGYICCVLLIYIIKFICCINVAVNKSISANA